MRNGMLSVALVVFAFTASTVSADDRGATRLSVMLTGLGYTESASNGSNWTGGASVALSHRFAPRWGLEASYGYEGETAFGPLMIDEMDGGQVIFVSRKPIPVNAQPLDVTGQYFFSTGSSRWKPYAGVGVRHTATPSGPDISQEFRETNPQVNLGSVLNLTPRLGLRFDAKYILQENAAPWDDALKTGLGLSWRF